MVWVQLQGMCPCYCSNSTAELRLRPFWNLLNSQEESGDDTAPPLGVKLTVYRLLNMTTMISFCFAKGILTYKGLSTVPTTLDWVSGGVLAAAWVYLVHFTKSFLLIWRLKSVLGWLVRGRTTLEEMGMVLPRWSGACDRLLRKACSWRV